MLLNEEKMIKKAFFVQKICVCQLFVVLLQSQKHIERVWLTTCVWLHSVPVVAIQRYRGKAKRMSYVKSGV